MSLPIIDGSSKALVGKLGVFVGMDYVGKVEFIFNKTIPAGKIPAFGLEYSRTTYNKLWEEVQKHPEWKLTEAAWQEFSKNNNGQVPYYSDGDGSTTFRVPCLTGFFEGAKSLEEVGTVKEAGLPNVTAKLGGLFNGSSYVIPTQTENVRFVQENGVNGVVQYITGNYNNTVIDMSLGSDVYGNSDTVQPPSIVGMWVITAFVAVTGIGSTTLNNIASGLTEIETRVGEIENNFKIIYPEKGSEDNLPNIKINSRYTLDNPFKGYYVECIAQVKYNNSWGVAPWFYVSSNSAYGVSCHQILPEDKIILQTGQTHFLARNNLQGHPFLGISSDINTPLPCRILVKKISKI